MEERRLYAVWNWHVSAVRAVGGGFPNICCLVLYMYVNIVQLVFYTRLSYCTYWRKYVDFTTRSVFVFLMLMFLSMGKNILRIYFVCVFQFEMMKPTRTRTQNIELTLYGLMMYVHDCAAIRPGFHVSLRRSSTNKSMAPDSI